MMLRLFLFAAGILLVGWLPELPTVPLLLLLLGLCVGLVVIARFLFPRHPYNCFVSALFALLLGVGIGSSLGYQLLANQLPEELVGYDIRVTGVLEGLPAKAEKRHRFNLRVTAVEDSRHQWLTGKKLRLSWYQRDISLQPSQHWQLQVRLRRPRGFVNPGGFDYQRWLLSEGFSATGYVRKSSWNHTVSPDHSLITAGLIDYWRWQLRQTILLLDLPEQLRGLVAALTIGDSSLLSRETWQQLSRSGVVHLLVISGLHIGLAGLLGYWLGAVVGRLVGLFAVSTVARYWGSTFSIALSGSYALLSGFGLPAQRALVMTLVVNLALLLNRSISSGQGFALALVAVALIDPLATHSAGFWLSFTAVAILLWFVPRYGQQQPGQGVGFRLKQFAIVQWLIFIGLFGLLMIWLLPQSLLSPLVNLIAIPWISFLVVPLCLMAVVCFPLFPQIAEQLWLLAGWQLELFSRSLHWLPILSAPELPHDSSVIAVILVITVLLLLPRGFPGKYLSLPLMVALVLMGESKVPPLTVAVLDVGQGLAVVVQTRKHVLVYDAGPLYSERFNAGSGIILPYLRKSGVGGIDTLVVSHGDYDHAGGVSGLLEKYQSGEIYAGEPLSEEMPSIPCQAGQQWHWGKVRFRFIYPDTAIKAASSSNDQSPNNPSSNNKSCVLLISYQGQHILFPGDIEKNKEYKLVKHLKDLGVKRLALLVAPHHGSATSSGSRFINALNPQHVVYSAGYRHHFGHPHPKVVARYTKAGAKQWNTADSGALMAYWDQQGKMSISEQRQAARRYWFQITSSE